MSVAVTPDSRYVVSGSDDRTNPIKVWDLKTGECLHDLESRGCSVSKVMVTPNGEHILSDVGDYKFKVWDFTTGECLRTINVNNLIFDMAITPDGSLLVLNVGRIVRGYISVWDLQKFEFIFDFEHTKVIPIDIIGNDRIIAGDMDGNFIVWTLAREEIKKFIPNKIPYLAGKI